MSSITIDDQSALIYKSPGGWTTDNNPDPNIVYQGTLSYSWTAGAYQTIRFIGTSITVMGWLDPIYQYNLFPVVVQFAIDDGPRTTYSPPAPNRFTKVTYYESPRLPMGEHVLRITNIQKDDVVEIDYFVIHASSGTPQLLRSDGSSRPSPPPPTSIIVPTTSAIIPTPTSISSQTSESSLSSSSSSESSPASDSTSTSDTATSIDSTPTPQPSRSIDFTMFHPPRPSGSSSETLSNGATANITGGAITPNTGTSATGTGAPAVVTTYQSTVLNVSSEPSSAADHRLIAAASCGGVFALLALILAGIMLFKRHRRKQQAQRTAVSFPVYTQSTKADAEVADSLDKPPYAAIPHWSMYGQPTNSSVISMETPFSTNNTVPPTKKGDAFSDRLVVERGDAQHGSEFHTQGRSRPSADLPAYTR